MPSWWPLAHFGKADAPLPDPRSPEADQDDPDDELLPETPPDVVMMLGFDPAKVDWSDEADEEKATPTAHQS